MGTCSPSPCGNGGTGEGGAAGSSFVSNAIQYPEVVQPYNVGDVFVEFMPVIEIDRPANGARYKPGQVVDASWSCGLLGLLARAPNSRDQHERQQDQNDSRQAHVHGPRRRQPAQPPGERHRHLHGQGRGGGK